MEGELKQNMLEHRRWMIQETIRTPCNGCGHADFRQITEENGLPIVACRRCALVSVRPRPTEAELKRFYAQYLESGAEQLWRRATEAMLQRDARRLARCFPAAGELLDVGCGFGFFLELMRARGWRVNGCDASAAAVDHARNRLQPASVRLGAFHELDWPPARFDLITFWYVLHHLADPRRALETAYAALRPGGLVAVRVPNLTLFQLLWLLNRFDSPPLRRLLEAIRKDTGSSNSPYNVLDPPVHLFGFTRTTLGHLLGSTGFQVTAVFNDGMVARGSWFNRLIDQSLTGLADLVLALTRSRLDLSICFSIYARKI